MADMLCLSFGRRSKIKPYLDTVSSWTNILKYTVLLLYLCNIASVQSSKQCLLCEEGRCKNDTCVCLLGWRGIYCNECHGRISLQGREGVIHDGSGNYSKDHKCSWLLDAEEPGMRVTLLINDLATECIWDHLYIHNGDSAFAPLIAAYSGVRSGTQEKPVLKFILTGRYAFFHFYSDAAFILNGFNITYIVDDCALGCSEHGVCNESRCECEEGWSGVNCESYIYGCPGNCSGHGNCLNGLCKCHEGFSGDKCNDSVRYLQVQRLPSPPFAVSGRASFAFAQDEDGNLWITGGYRMGISSTEENLLRYHINSETWAFANETNTVPWPRHGHTTVFYKGALYLYGGVKVKEIMDDLWMYTISSGSWTKLTSGPRNLSGHAAEVVGSKMLIFFGFSTDYGYSNKVLEYDFVNMTWTMVKTQGSVVQGGYGHTSVHDKQRKRIYVYGGYHSPGSTNYNMTDMLYEYEPTKAQWFILHSSGKGHYLHSAAMMNGLMLVFGGNTNNDSRRGRHAHAECFTSDFLVYDRDCNEWYSLHTYLTSHGDGLDRFGQRMLSVGKDVYIFGGFHAWSKADLWKIKAGTCSSIQDMKSCKTSVPGIKCVWNGTNCISDSDAHSKKCKKKIDVNSDCSGFNRCDGCLSRDDCKWCSGSCVSDKATGQKNCTLQRPNCSTSVGQNCAMYQSCESCQENSDCVWAIGKCKAFVVDKKSNKTALKCEEKKCSQMDSCLSCTQADCMWCSNLKQCILTNSYVAYYFYGQCMDWTTRESLCQVSNCSAMKTCADCIALPRCGWCDDNSGTGTGFCHEGGMSGPIVVNTTKPTTDLEVCPVKRWFFNGCPKCQCNGHSQCVNGTDGTKVCANCLSHTSGPSCQYCEDGFFGTPLNGGNCSECVCNGQADSCDSVTGNCFCKIRGVIGGSCERCDEDYKHIDNPVGGGTCFYHLNTDFSYTFNLSKKEDSNYTQINFINTPTSSDRDVDFTLNCSSLALINITYTSKSFPVEKEYVSNRVCDYFRTKFEHKNHAFGPKENTTFYVYVFDFKTPFKLQISFVQRDKLNLVRFFIIFFSCFLSLLLIAAALWKIKHKYDSYRRRRQLIVEMQQMASRPFSSVMVEIDRKSNNTTIDKRDHLDSVLRRRKKTGNKPSEVAIEPLMDSKAAILTLIIQLPTGAGDFAPAGQSGLAIGSALVSMGSHRKQSLDHAKGDKQKLRKHISNIHPDTCA